MKCKNIECNNKTIGNKIYCSFKCRNIFVNTHLRDYSKLSNYHSNKRKNLENEYLTNPNFCKQCNIIIEFGNHKNSNFCSHSCATTFHNLGRTVSNSTKKSISKKLKDRSDQIGRIKVACKECAVEINKWKDGKRSIFCSNECKIKNHQKFKNYNSNISLITYRALCKFKFNIFDYPEKFDLKLIEQYGLYSPINKKNNLNGISRDHMVSVQFGFENNIPPEHLAHPANCKLMIHNENISKNRKCSITYHELLERIKNW